VTPPAALTPPTDDMFVAFLEAAPDAMVCIAADGLVVRVNAQAERLFGYERAELIGQRVEIGVPDTARAAQLRVKDLEPASESRESFIDTVSHDLRAPLRALSGYSGVLLEDYGEVLGAEGRGYAERIVAASDQMRRLLDYLLQVSRTSRAELDLQRVDLGGEAARIVEEIQRREPARRVRFAIQQPVQAWADTGLVRTVLENLLDNAWKFTSGQDDASIEFGTAPSGDAAVCCYVRDNGVGFDPAYAGKLFQPFQRLHAARDFPNTGTGTGLASVRQIVELHGGRVRAEGAVGAGATFYFTLDGKEST
jgi:signal transduction histidine kinase